MPHVPELIGRRAELRELDSLLASVGNGKGDGSGCGLFVHGAAGLGKTRLVDAAAHRWQAFGGRLLRTEGVLSEMRLPLAAVHKLVRPALEQAERLEPRHRVALRSAFGFASTPPPEISLIALAVLELLAEVARAEPLLVIVEDAHWLDQASAHVVAFVARRLGTDRVALLVSSREHSGIVTASGLPTLLLAPLGDRAAGQLLRAVAPDLPDVAHRRVKTMAAGNPLALVELAEALKRSPLVDGASDPLPMTDRLERAFATRISGLPPRTVDLLLAAAVNDSDSVDEILAALALVKGEPVDAEALQPAIAAGLVDVRGGALRFSHPLVRSAAERSSTLSQRQAMHRALADILVSDPDRRPWHRAEATLGADEDVAMDLASAAHRALSRGATTEATAALDAAARFSVDAGRRAEHRLRAAELVAETGAPGLEARLPEPVEIATLGLHERLRWECVREIADRGAMSGVKRLDELVALAEEAQSQGNTDTAMLFLVRAGRRCFEAELGTDAEERVIAAANQMPLDEVDPRRMVVRAYASPFAHAAEVIELLGRPGITDRADSEGLHLLGHAAACVGAFAEAEACCTAAADALRAQGRLPVLAQALRLLAWATVRRSRWDTARAAAEEAARLAEETRQPRVMADALAAQAMVAALRDDLDTAEGLAEHARSLASSDDASITKALLQLVRAATSAAAGHPDEAFHQLHRIYLPGDPAHQRMQACWAVGTLADYAVRSGREDEARLEVARFEPLVAGSPSVGVQAAMHTARALLAPGGDAEPLFVEALKADPGPWPFDRARTQLAYGEWLRRRKRLGEARVPLRAARDTFDRLGAAGWAEHARRELLASGEASGRHRPGVWEDLTPQELQIAFMVGEGLTNKEIGARLFLSHRTVAGHLYRVFPKLGVTSRSELARLIRSSD